MASAPIEGRVDERFSAVRDAFARNFAEEDEVGAGVCLQIGGRVVVDLWGGHTDPERTRPWQEHTVVNAYSVGKGILALLTMTLVERGVLRLDTPVARTWPAFGAADKGDITLRQLLAHQAGLPAVRERLPEGAMLDWTCMCDALARQAPWWAPGTAHGYHVNTYGYLVGEVIRRATGQRVGEVLRETLCGPIGADYHYGLPTARHADAAIVIAPQPTLTTEAQWSIAFPPTGDHEHDTMIWHAYFNPSGISGMGTVNTPGWRLAEIPSTNGHGTARAVTALYALALRDDDPGPSRASIAEATRVHSDGPDRVLSRPSRFGLGFQLPSEDRPIGPHTGAFGHYGYGGTLGFADPEADLAFGYVMNRPGDRWQTVRTQRLIDAVYDCLD